jgi:hypothetical protein
MMAFVAATRSLDEAVATFFEEWQASGPVTVRDLLSTRRDYLPGFDLPAAAAGRSNMTSA